MTSPPVGRGSVIALAGGVSLAVGFVGRLSFAASAAVLAALAVAFRVVWWLPWACALALVAAVPVVAARASSHAADTVAGYVVVFLAIGFCLLVRDDRRRRRAR